MAYDEWGWDYEDDYDWEDDYSDWVDDDFVDSYDLDSIPFADGEVPEDYLNLYSDSGDWFGDWWGLDGYDDLEESIDDADRGLRLAQQAQRFGYLSDFGDPWDTATDMVSQTYQNVIDGGNPWLLTDEEVNQRDVTEGQAADQALASLLDNSGLARDAYERGLSSYDDFTLDEADMARRARERDMADYERFQQENEAAARLRQEQDLNEYDIWTQEQADAAEAARLRDLSDYELYQQEEEARARNSRERDMSDYEIFQMENEAAARQSRERDLPAVQATDQAVVDYLAGLIGGVQHGVGERIDNVREGIDELGNFARRTIEESPADVVGDAIRRAQSGATDLIEQIVPPANAEPDDSSAIPPMISSAYDAVSAPAESPEQALADSRVGTDGLIHYPIREVAPDGRVGHSGYDPIAKKSVFIPGAPPDNTSLAPSTTPVASPVNVPDAAIASPRNAIQDAIGQFGELIPNQASFKGYDPDVWSICGPVAAIAFARATGRNPTMEEAKELATKVGWTAANGMAGPESQKKLLDGLGVPSVLEWAPSDAKAQAQLADGNPVIISTPRHYFVLQGYDPQTGKYDTGPSGSVVGKWGGQQWMTMDQIARAGGGFQASLYLDTPNQPPAPARPTETIANPRVVVPGATSPGLVAGKSDPQQAVNRIYNIAAQAGGDDFAKDVGALVLAERGFNGDVGDNGQSFGPFQLYTGGKLADMMQRQGMSRDEAIATAMDIDKSTAFATSYLKPAWDDATARGLTGQDRYIWMIAKSGHNGGVLKADSPVRANFLGAYDAVSKGAPYKGYGVPSMATAPGDVTVTPAITSGPPRDGTSGPMNIPGRSGREGDIGRSPGISTSPTGNIPSRTDREGTPLAPSSPIAQPKGPPQTIIARLDPRNDDSLRWFGEYMRWRQNGGTGELRQAPEIAGVDYYGRTRDALGEGQAKWLPTMQEARAKKIDDIVSRTGIEMSQRKNRDGTPAYSQEEILQHLDLVRREAETKYPEPKFVGGDMDVYQQRKQSAEQAGVPIFTPPSGGGIINPYQGDVTRLNPLGARGDIKPQGVIIDSLKISNGNGNTAWNQAETALRSSQRSTNFVVQPDGRVVRLMPESAAPRMTGFDDIDAASLGVTMLTGNGREAGYTKKQIDSLQWLLAELAKVHGTKNVITRPEVEYSKRIKQGSLTPQEQRMEASKVDFDYGWLSPELHRSGFSYGTPYWDVRGDDYWRTVDAGWRDRDMNR